MSAAFEHGFFDVCKLAGVTANLLVKFAEPASNAFRELQETFTPANGFHLNRKPGDEWSYTAPVGIAKTRDEAEDEVRNTGFGFHSPRVNDYLKQYAVGTGADLLDIAESAETQKELEENFTKEELRKLLPDSKFQSEYYKNLAEHMFDKQGPVPTIPQNFAQQAYENFHKLSAGLKGNGTIPSELMDKARKGVDMRAYSRIDTPSSQRSIDETHYESLPANTNDQDIRALAAIEYAKSIADPIYSDTDRFLKGYTTASPAVYNNISKNLGVLVSNDLNEDARAYYSPSDRSAHLPLNADKATALHEFGHGLADEIGKAAPGYSSRAVDFEPAKLFRHPTMLEEHGNADTLLGAGVMDDRTAGEWYYGNMLKNRYASMLHEAAGTTPHAYSTFDEAVSQKGK